MTHDEDAYHAQQHRQWQDEQRTYGSSSDMDILRQLAMDRKDKERREQADKDNYQTEHLKTQS